MAISAFSGLQTALRGLAADQRMLAVTAHNIANVSTQGYSRQEGVLVSTAATSAGAHLGAGVEIQSYRRIRDVFLDLQYRAQNANLAEWRARSNALETAELSLAEPGENGLGAQLAKFWDAWSNLANTPADTAVKQVVVERANALADTFSAVRSQLDAARSLAAARYSEITRPASATDPGGEVARVAAELANLNAVIAESASAGVAPNDLMHRRDLLLDKLSGYGRVSIQPLASGTLNVSFIDISTGSAYPIVSDRTPTWTGPPPDDSWSPSGQIGGLLAACRPGGIIEDHLGTLDAIATALATAVNDIYGSQFFAVGSPPAATLSPSAGIALAPSTIATGSGGTGANDIALRIARLRGNSAIDGAYRAFATRVGANVAGADRRATNAQTLTDAAEDRRQSVAGVSLDEEMVNLIRFQRGYQGSARVLTVDQMLDVLINRTGRVGL